MTTSVRSDGARHGMYTVSGPPPGLTPAERAEFGRAIRQRVPRSSHGEFRLEADRPDPVSLLEAQASTRVPELVPVRHGRMLESEFTFFRGAAIIMASDLARTPRTGLSNQLCGDAHLLNFGLFGSPERRMVFDLNDFDETYPGPWEWDLKRLVTSVAIAGRHRRFSPDQRRRAALATAAGYRVEMNNLAHMSHLGAWYRHVDVDELLREVIPQLRASGRREARRTIDKARTRDSMQALAKLTRVVDGQVRIVSNPPVVVPLEELLPDGEARDVAELLARITDTYLATLRPDVRHLFTQYQVVHVAHKVVGVGSVGTRAWIALHLGRDGRDPFFLQAKEAQDSVLQQFVPSVSWENNGERVVVGQHLMQAVTDIFLGWARVVGLDGQERDFYLRQLRDWKGSIEPETMLPRGLALYGQLCGMTLARAHARSGDRIAIAGYMGNGPAFDKAIAKFAEAYADQNAQDYAAFHAAIVDGRLEARTGV